MNTDTVVRQITKKSQRRKTATKQRSPALLVVCSCVVIALYSKCGTCSLLLFVLNRFCDVTNRVGFRIICVGLRMAFSVTLDLCSITWFSTVL